MISLFETNQRLLENNQSLQLNYQMLLSSGADKTSKVVKVDDDEEGAPVQNEEVAEQEEAPPEKKGFLYWLFH